ALAVCFSSSRRHPRFSRDWSSDVCSSDLGLRWHKSGPGTMVGSLLLGLYDDQGVLHHVGVAASFTAKRRRELAAELEPLRAGPRSEERRVGTEGRPEWR